MRVLIDSNILFSAAYAKGSVPHQAYAKAVEPPCQCIVSELPLEEIRRAYSRKFPERAGALERFIASALTVVEVVPVPHAKHPDEDEIRDPDGRPILRSAIEAAVDIIATGDKDFLESGLGCPQIMTAAAFLRMP